MGVIYRVTSGGKALRNRLSAEDRQELLDAYYRPHHRSLSDAITQSLNVHGHCLVIDAHSFSSKPLPHEPDQSSDRCDVCIGTDEFHTPSWLASRLKTSFEENGLSVALNRPFSGTLVPSVFHRKNPRVLSMMIEVNRSLYMDEMTGSQLPGFGEFQVLLRRALLDLATMLWTRLAT